MSIGDMNLYIIKDVGGTALEGWVSKDKAEERKTYLDTLAAGHTIEVGKLMDYQTVGIR